MYMAMAMNTDQLKWRQIHIIIVQNLKLLNRYKIRRLSDRSKICFTLTSRSHPRCCIYSGADSEYFLQTADDWALSGFASGSGPFSGSDGADQEDEHDRLFPELRDTLSKPTKVTSGMDESGPFSGSGGADQEDEHDRLFPELRDTLSKPTKVTSGMDESGSGPFSGSGGADQEDEHDRLFPELRDTFSSPTKVTSGMDEDGLRSSAWVPPREEGESSATGSKPDIDGLPREYKTSDWCFLGHDAQLDIWWFNLLAFKKKKKPTHLTPFSLGARWIEAYPQ